MPTTTDGLYYPDEATNIAPLHTLLAGMQASVQTALNVGNRIYSVANVTERAALAVAKAPISTSAPLFVWRADAHSSVRFELTVDGINWSKIPVNGVPIFETNTDMTSGITGVNGMIAVTADYGIVWRYNGSQWRVVGVPTFADTTARDAALTRPIIGDMCTTGATIWIYSGAVWYKVGSDAVKLATIEAKGDLLVGTANDALTRLPSVDAADYLLITDPATATGMKWIHKSSLIDSTVQGLRAKMEKTSTGPSLSDPGWKKITGFTAATYNPEGMADTGSGNINISATGNYQITLYFPWKSMGTAYRRQIAIVKGTGAPTSSANPILATEEVSAKKYWKASTTFNGALNAGDAITFWIYTDAYATSGAIAASFDTPPTSVSVLRI